MGRPLCWQRKINLEALPENTRGYFELCKCSKVRCVLVELLSDFHVDSSQPYHLVWQKDLIQPHLLDIDCPLCANTGLVPLNHTVQLIKLFEALLIESLRK
jgi:hypothetical protein